MPIEQPILERLLANQLGRKLVTDGHDRAANLGVKTERPDSLLERTYMIRFRRELRERRNRARGKPDGDRNNNQGRKGEEGRENDDGQWLEAGSSEGKEANLCRHAAQNFQSRHQEAPRSFQCP